jgi:Fur family ferric uptake transcriptional regulator
MDQQFTMTDDILKRNKLSVTDGRKKILGLFLARDGALAHADIEKFTGEMFDRVTVYRTLQTFV